VPNFKAHGHRATAYGRFQTAGNLFRARGYRRGNPGQRSLWENSVNPAGGATQLRTQLGMREDGTYIVEARRVRGAARYRRFGDPATIARGLVRPFWKRDGSGFAQHDVDHIVELQVAGWQRVEAGNSISNMEMLDHDPNMASGRTIRRNIINSVKAFLDDSDKQSQVPEAYRPSGNRASEAQAERVKANFDLVFSGIQGSGTPGADAVSYYEKEEVAAGNHIPPLVDALSRRREGNLRALDLGNPAGDNRVFSRHNLVEENQIGSAEKFVIYPYVYGGQPIRYDWPNGGQETERALSGAEARRIRGIRAQRLRFTPDDPRYVGGLWAEPFWFQRNEAGSWVAMTDPTPHFWAIPRYFRRPGPVYAGYLDTGSIFGYVRRRFQSPGMSPITFDRAYIDEEAGLTGVGKIRSNLPILPNVEIDIVLQGDDLRVQKLFTQDQFEFPGPIQVTQSNLLVSIGTRTGLEMAGQVDFGIERVGEGYIGGRAGTVRGFRLEGGFSFDSDLFEPAEIRAWYENRRFGAEGQLTIPQGKLRGIRSATIRATYNEGRLEAAGTVQPDIPGVEQGSIILTYSEAEGISIGGTLNLSADVPGIRSGSVSVTVAKPPAAEEWAVSASGEATPDIPGIDSRLEVAYQDGAFTVSGTASYRRGLLSGSVTVGATNRTLDPEGNPTGEPTTTLTAYGGGSVTIQIAPWLQGTVGVRFLPNGEMELSGGVSLPAALELFPEKSYDRNIFSIGIDIPIVGVAVAGQRIGIFATIRGGLDLSAGVGPGELRELGLTVTYNPDREQETRVSGGAQLVIPAHAGLRLFVRGGIGAGIPIVSATANLEIGGQLGLEGAVQAQVQVDWNPVRGLDIQARGEIFVEPKLKFDVAAMVLVEADLLLTTIELYSKRWNLAEFEFGSGLRFGIALPIHYREGEPFDVSWDDVEFQVPDIDTDEVLASLFQRIA